MSVKRRFWRGYWVRLVVLSAIAMIGMLFFALFTIDTFVSVHVNVPLPVRTVGFLICAVVASWFFLIALYKNTLWAIRVRRKMRAVEGGDEE